MGGGRGREEEKRPSFFIGETDKTLKIVGPNEEEIPLDEVVVPPDGGWGWVIVLASFLSNLVVDGTVFSFGILLNPIHEASERSIPISSIAWVGSLATGFYFLAGPVVSAVANRFGFRVVAITGSLIASVSVGMAWLLCRDGPVLWALYLCYGVLGGIGFGMIYVPAVIAVGFYFEKKRALATGMAICGSGIGCFLFPPLMNYLISEWGYRGALLFQALVILLCALFALLYRPLKPQKIGAGGRRKSGVSILSSPAGTPLLQRIQKARAAEMEKWDSVNSFQIAGFGNSSEGLNGNISGRVRRGSNPGILLPPPGLAPPKRGSVPTMLSSSFSGDGQVSIPPKGKSFVGLPLPDLPEEEHSEDPSSREPSPGLTLTQPAGESLKNENNNLVPNRINSVYTMRIGNSTLEVDELKGSRILRIGSKASLSKPMYRDDIFYSGSLLRLPQYKETRSSAEWAAAVVSGPPETKEAEGEEEEEEGGFCSAGVMKKMLDFSLLASPTFLILSLSGFFTMLGLFVPFTYLKGVAVEAVGLSDSTAAVLVSIIGVANTTGRVIAGWIGDRPEINVLFLNNASVTVIGLATAAIPFLTSFESLVGFACVFGLAMAFFASLRSILLVELLGLEKLTNAFGLSLLFQGIAAILGTPLAGFLYEATGAYSIPFWVAGGFLVLSGVMCYPLNLIKNWEDRRKKEEGSCRS